MYEYIYELSCDCQNNSFDSYGKQEHEKEIKRNFGSCDICGKPYVIVNTEKKVSE